MFSDSKAPEPGDERGFKTHMPHFFPWLCNGLKTHQNSDLALGGPYKRSTEPRVQDPTQQEKSKELIQGSGKEKNSVARSNGVGLAKRLPRVLRGRQILSESPGKRSQRGSGRKDPSPEHGPKSDSGTNPSQDRPQSQGNSYMSVKDFCSEYSFVRNPDSHLNLIPTHIDWACPPLRKYGPLASIPAPVPPGQLLFQEAPNSKEPAVMNVEEEKEKLLGYVRHTYQRRDHHSSSWLNSTTWGSIDRQQSCRTSFNCTEEGNKYVQSHINLAGLKEPTMAGFNNRSSLNGGYISAERPQTGVDFTRTLRGPKKTRPKSEQIPTREQDKTCVQRRTAEPHSAANETGQPGPRCNRKAIRNQIRRVVDNLEQVVGAIKNVQQEMKEVVEQIENLTSSIDLNEEEQEERGGGGGGGGGDDGAGPPCDSSSSSSSGSCSSGVPAGSHPPRLSEEEEDDDMGNAKERASLKRGRLLNHAQNHSPTSRLPPRTQNTVQLSAKKKTLRCTGSIGSPPKRGAPPSYPHLVFPVSSSPKPGRQPQPPPASQSFVSSPRRNSPFSPRPPTPGLSPLTLNFPANTSTSSVSPSPRSPRTPSPLSARSPQTPALSVRNASVFKQVKSGACESPSRTQPPAPSCHPETMLKTDKGSQASSAVLHQLAPRESTTVPEKIKNPLAQGRRGREPPPYPHYRLFERGKKAKAPRKAPPYPEKRRLLSTTV